MRRGNPTLNIKFDTLIKVRGRGFKLKDLPNICFYCGDYGNEKEHVIPYCYVGDNTPMVWSCRECNGLAGSKVFNSLRDKCVFINERLKEKYKDILEVPLWGDDELDELDGGLKQYIIGMVNVQKWIRSRIAWETSPTILCVAKFLMDLDERSDSPSLFAEKIGVDLSELIFLIGFDKRLKPENDDV